MKILILITGALLSNLAVTSEEGPSWKWGDSIEPKMPTYLKSLEETKSCNDTEISIAIKKSLFAHLCVQAFSAVGDNAAAFNQLLEKIY